MSMAEEAQRLAKYNTWVATKKATAMDVSPEAYVLDKAKEEAFERVVKAVDYLESINDPDDWDTTEEALYNILTGEGE